METATALVTGAASGIGLACARQLASRRPVLLLDRDDNVDAVAAQLCADGFQAHSVTADLADVDTLPGRVQDLERSYGPIAILVNNAGVHPKRDGHITAPEAVTLAEWDTVLRINLTAAFFLCQGVLPGMKARRWGRIVNIASRAGRTWSDRAGIHYSASKAGLIGMTRKLAGDYAPHGITANCVAPGQISTPLGRQHDPAVLARVVANTPAQRLGTPEEVAAAVGYRSSEEAAFVTGAVLDVNGGGFIAS